MESNSLSLYQLNEQIKRSLKASFPNALWITAEISEIRSNSSGHCYLELVEKDTQSDQIIAKARATIWAYTFRMLKPYFETTTGHELTSGLKVMVSVSVEFHEKYGISLNIKDIDPAYTLGDIARKRLEILKKLEEEGVIDMNREIDFPALPQKIAVISSKTAAGYGDFIDQLENNQYGYKFYHKLFPAFVQGDQAEKSIISAIERIYNYSDFFDAVVIIRGGGSQADLNCFDSYWLAYHITQFPLPVVSGIGHERDETITDRVSHTSVKTPTAVAEFLISKMYNTDSLLHDLQNSFVTLIEDSLKDKSTELENLQYKITSGAKSSLSKQNNTIQAYKTQLGRAVKNYCQSNHRELAYKVSVMMHKLENDFLKHKQEHDSITNRIKVSTLRLLDHKKHFLELKKLEAENIDPSNVLRRGYSITSMNGRIIKNLKEIKVGDSVETKFIDGKISSTVTKAQKI